VIRERGEGCKKKTARGRKYNIKKHGEKGKNGGEQMNGKNPNIKTMSQ